MSWRQTILILVCLAAGGCASPVREAVEGANWAGPKDSPPDMRFFPPQARHDGKSAVVGLSCWMGADGRLSECKVGYVSTPGYGFEAAALSMADEVVIRPREARVVVAANVDYATTHHLPITPGGGWVKQPIFMPITPGSAWALAKRWVAEGAAATARFAESRPDRHG